jgi:ATP:cob(I)alamin adenosyltransferase
MNIYTKNGDGGMTSLINTSNIPKSDDRIELVGTLDELNSHLGLIKARALNEETKTKIIRIQNNLMTIMAGIADSHNKKYKLPEGELADLEGEIDRLESLFSRHKGFVLPGENTLSAQMDVARTVSRRAERRLSAVSIKFGSDAMTKKYLNRLADYLYVLARYTDVCMENRKEAGLKEEPPVFTDPGAAAEKKEQIGGGKTMETSSDALVQEVLRRVSAPSRLTLEQAKLLIEKVEIEARRQGKKAVIAVCGPEGNPIAVHVMDDAFLVSFDVAMKKAYTSVAVKMSTKELSVLAQPGGTFYGVDKMDGGKIVIFGGGIPLKYQGRIIGGLGVSGGTGEEDHALAEYGQEILAGILG